MKILSVSYKRRLRGLLIYPQFQLRLTFLNGLILVIAIGANAFSSWQMFAHMQELGNQVGLPKDHVYFKFIDMQMHSWLLYSVIATTLALVATVVVSLMISHKVAGPIVRLRSFVAGVRESGSVSSPLEFRKNDFFQELPQELTAAFRQLQSQNEKVK